MRGNITIHPHPATLIATLSLRNALLPNYPQYTNHTPPISPQYTNHTPPISPQYTNHTPTLYQYTNHTRPIIHHQTTNNIYPQNKPTKYRSYTNTIQITTTRTTTTRSRDRNREHAKNTRLRKKAYVGKLKVYSWCIGGV
jgi:hypothetical protein